MKRILFSTIIIFLTISILTYATDGDPTPFGNSTTDTAWIGGSNGIVNLTGTAYANEFSGPLNWTYLQNYPDACGAGDYVTTIGDTLTCTTPTDTTYTAEEDLIYLDGTEFKSNETVLNESIESFGYATSADIIAFGYYNSTDFVITDYFTKTEITNFGYYNSSDFSISDYFTSSEVLAFNYYNSTDFSISDYVTSSTLDGYNYWNDTYATFNKTYADTLYYDLGNSFGYYNVTTAPTYVNDTFSANYSTYLTLFNWNKTYADTLYADISVVTDNSSWNQTFADTLYADISVTGDVTKVNTPANDQIGVWTGDGTIEGVSTFTYDAVNGISIDSGNADSASDAGLFNGIINNNVGAGVNSGIFITNNNAQGYNWASTNYPSGTGVHIVQAGASGTALSIYGANNVNTAALAHLMISDTQSGVSKLLSIDIGAANQAIEGIQITGDSANSAAIAFHSDMQTGFGGDFFQAEINNVEKFAIDKDGQVTTGMWNSTDIGVAYGGTGASTLTNHGVLVGSGTGAITALTVGTNGQILIGSTDSDPVFATLTAGDSLTATIGAGTLELDVDDDFLKNSGGDTGAGNYVFEDNLTVENIFLEVDSTNHRIYDNATCVIIKGDTSTLTIC